jgi:putative MFS transporter
MAADGASVAHVSGLLAKAALFAIPTSLIAAFFYARWSSKWTLFGATAVMALALGAFAVFGHALVRHPGVLTLALVLLLSGIWALISVLAPYSAEIFPTDVRAAGAGWIAGASKFGGVAALTLAALSIDPPSLTGGAIVAAVPAAAAAILALRWGIETKSRQLEDIAAAIAEA